MNEDEEGWLLMRMLFQQQVMIHFDQCTLHMDHSWSQHTMSRVDKKCEWAYHIGISLSGICMGSKVEMNLQSLDRIDSSAELGAKKD